MQQESDYACNSIVMSRDGFSQILENNEGKDYLWTTDINKELPIKMPRTGKSS